MCLGLPLGARRTRARVVAVLSFGLVPLALACGGDDDRGTAPPPLATNPTATATSEPEPVPVDAAPAVDAAPPDAGPESRRWTGTRATTIATLFGGSPYCQYRVTLKQIEVDITVQKTGEVIAANVKNVVTEESVPPCTYAPQAPNNHGYSFSKASRLASGAVRIELAPYPTNRPQGTLVIEGTLDGNDATASPTLEWHRTDQPAPLDWRVKASVPLTQR